MVNFRKLRETMITLIGALITFYKVIVYEYWLGLKWWVIEWYKRKTSQDIHFTVTNKNPTLSSGVGFKVTNEKREFSPYLTPGKTVFVPNPRWSLKETIPHRENKVYLKLVNHMIKEFKHPGFRDSAFPDKGYTLVGKPPNRLKRNG